MEKSSARYEAAACRRPWLALYGGSFEPGGSPASTALDLFRQAVASRPQATALLYFDASIDYAELDLLSDRLAHWWASHGVTAGDRIAIILQNVPQFVVAAVAAWKLQAIPVTMNPMYRTAELSKLFSDCAPAAIICHDDEAANVAEATVVLDRAPVRVTTGAHLFQSRDDARTLPPRSAAAKDELAAILATPSTPPPAVALRADDVGLLLYTSGTTGAPKGAMIPHSALVHNAEAQRLWFGHGPETRIFGVAPLFHITGFECQMMAAFASAGAMVLTYRFAAEVALDAFEEHRPTFVIGAITAYAALMNCEAATPAHFASFVHLYSGGAPIAPALVERFATRFGRSIRSCYGMTELTAPCHLSPPDGVIPVDRDSGALAIGIPTPGTDVIITNDERQPLGPGEVGEIVVRGAQVMTGYWGKPEETDLVLVDGWMHTGDVGFFDAQGWFYLVDRKKDVIIASGYKIWPREVEDVLYAYSGVREAAVIGEPDPYRGETVVAFVSPCDGVTLDADALNQHCREKLAAYKCPRRIEICADLPKTITGKISRQSLRG